MKSFLKKFDARESKRNLTLLLCLQPGELLKTEKNGKLVKITSPWTKGWLYFQDLLFCRKESRKVEYAIYLSMVTFCLTLYQPVQKAGALKILHKKVALAKRLLEKALLHYPTLAREKIEYHIEYYQRMSLLQLHVVENMRRAVSQTRKSRAVHAVEEGLKLGMHPQLLVKGLSGSYWMRGKEGERLGIFKPFDEEVFAPNNPIGATHQGALGERQMRDGIRVGEAAHREVAAYVVDQFFGFGIVPKTTYAQFEHESFFISADKKADRKETLRQKKKKMGSFQEKIGGFIPLHEENTEGIDKIPGIEFQLLVVLDIILGNTDRNLANILVGEGKIAAIDHGLCFSDLPEDMLVPWSFLPQSKKPLVQPLQKLLLELPLDLLGNILRKRCFLSVGAVARMRERVALASAATIKGLTPYQMQPLFSIKYLEPLMDLTTNLAKKAHEQVEMFMDEFPALRSYTSG